MWYINISQGIRLLYSLPRWIIDCMQLALVGQFKIRMLNGQKWYIALYCATRLALYLVSETDLVLATVGRSNNCDMVWLKYPTWLCPLRAWLVWSLWYKSSGGTNFPPRMRIHLYPHQESTMWVQIVLSFTGSRGTPYPLNENIYAQNWATCSPNGGLCSPNGGSCSPNGGLCSPNESTLAVWRYPPCIDMQWGYDKKDWRKSKSNLNHSC